MESNNIIENWIKAKLKQDISPEFREFLMSYPQPVASENSNMGYNK